MGFNEEIKEFASSIKQRTQSIKTEEATKMSLVLPFFQKLGYDVFNPAEFCPEYTADVGIKKGEKVDYAILDEEGNPSVLIECKWCGDSLEKHGSQLFRYFSTTTAKFGILTNEIIYKFYTDLEEMNKMDLVPFWELNLLQLSDIHLHELKKFCKVDFDSENIFSTAEELKYSNLIKQVLSKELSEPSDDFVRFLLTEIYDGAKTQKIIDKFSPIVKRAFTGFINDIVNKKISSALNTNSDEMAITKVEEPAAATETSPSHQSKIVTTEEEIEAYYIIKGFLAGVVPIDDVAHRDTESYFGILYQDNNRKPICRINLDKKKKQILIPDANKKFERFYIDSLNDLYQYKDKLIEVVSRYTGE